MGEMAEYYLEQSIGQYWDGYDDGDDLPDPFFRKSNKAHYVNCKYCNKDCLQWIETKDGWRLVDRELKVHSCKEYFDKQQKNSIC